MADRASLADIAADILTKDDPTPPARSLGPDDPVCAPVMTERQRRKAVDAQFDLRLRRIERNSRITLAALCIMVAFAGLEYAGILGRDGQRMVWATAVFDGLAPFVR